MQNLGGIFCRVEVLGDHPINEPAKLMLGGWCCDDLLRDGLAFCDSGALWWHEAVGVAVVNAVVERSVRQVGGLSRKVSRGVDPWEL
jgi:hypothetical protein